ncbi:heme o synthase [Buchnera aphidicola]|uniref:heme o synthase n=1 Tax=Buchnera aphidicola TaxID=9 RepID=UPI001650B78E|nr:heme o synthase [Buchnera aphidicola]
MYLLEVLKPKIILGNLLSLYGGYGVAARGHIYSKLLFLDSLSLFLIVGSACVLNNVIDCDIDKIMLRTQCRLLVKYNKFCKLAILIAMFMLFLGLILCVKFINVVCFCLFLLGWLTYIFLYSFFLKKTSAISTIVGSISGSLPPIVGYCSVTNNFDFCSLNLLIMFALWQIPHSYAICILHFRDYKIANIPVFPVIYGFKITRYHIILHIILFFISVIVLTFINSINYKFLIISFFLCLTWLYYSLLELTIKNSKLWAKNIFRWSIIVIFLLNIIMLFGFV